MKTNKWNDDVRVQEVIVTAGNAENKYRCPIPHIAHRQANRQMHRQTNRHHTDKQTDRQTDRQTNRNTDN